ncbi:hypothetical protein 1 [Hubei rhabdo-like virus 4]|uniref:Uncharacterized protein n=1 Tax=Hubei rhabdo-like virus 4 TaxID=1923188 RepID=A0A1L3KMJ0_9MONO|nr:hypothetical protein 1 [Hubei rhabdo-like virus 4]APG78630.1 hypothetical protein 1 [Hubei rhabdo-like virus 4]
MTDKQAANAGMLPPPEVSEKIESIASALPEIDFNAAAALLPSNTRGIPPSSKKKGKQISPQSHAATEVESSRQTPIPAGPKVGASGHSSTQRSARGVSRGRVRPSRQVFPPRKLASVFQEVDEADLPEPTLADPVTSDQIDRMSEVSSRMQEMIQDHEDIINSLAERLENMEKSYGILLTKHTNLQKECDGLKVQVEANKRGPQAELRLGGSNSLTNTPFSSSTAGSSSILNRPGFEQAPKPTIEGGTDSMVAGQHRRRRAKY